MRIVFSDLDGTLLDTKKRVPARTLAVLDELARRGVEFVPCSGRSASGLPPELLASPAVHYAVCANGATICRIRSAAAALGEAPDAEMLHSELMSRGDALALYDWMDGRDVIFDVFGDDTVYESRSCYERIEEFGLDPNFIPQMRKMRTPVDEPIPDVIRRAGRLERCTVMWKDPADRQRAIDFVESRPSLAWVSSMPTNVEVSSTRASKGAGLTWLCEHLGIPVSEAVAFGDSLNDASMLKVAGDGVAMANSTPDAFAVADHTCEDNDTPGVALYLERLL